MDIQNWLDTFKQAWIAHDIDRVLALFLPTVEYWETPYVRLDSFDTLAKEWQGVRQQSDIVLSLMVFSSTEDAHTVLWDLTYGDASGTLKHWAGTYLIRLDEAGKCTYFHQTGESKQ